MFDARRALAPIAATLMLAGSPAVHAQPASQPASQPTSQPASRPASQPTSRPAAAPASQPAGPRVRVAEEAMTVAVGQTGLSMPVPAGWAHSMTGEVFTLGRPDGSAVLTVIPTPVDQLQAALKEVDALLGRKVETVKLGSPMMATLADMPAMAIDGTGALGGVPVDVGLIVLIPSKGWAVVAFSLAPTKRPSAATHDLAAWMAGLKRDPSKPAGEPPWGRKAAATPKMPPPTGAPTPPAAPVAPAAPKAPAQP